MTIGKKEKAVEWRVFLTPFEHKELTQAAIDVGIPAYRKAVIMSMAFTLFKERYGKKSEK